MTTDLETIESDRSDGGLARSFDQSLLRQHARQLWGVTFRWMLWSWAVGFAGTIFAAAALPSEVGRAAIMIAIASGLIGCLPVWIGLLPPVERGQAASASRRSIHHFVRGAIGGMVLRAIGTVALFLTCRYHMAASVEWIAAFTIGWYVVLTTVEVVALVHHSTHSAESLGGLPPGRPSRQYLPQVHSESPS